MLYQRLASLLRIWESIKVAMLESDYEVVFHLLDKNRSKSIFISQFSTTSGTNSKFILYVKTLKLLIQQLKLKSNKTTIRDIYYKDVELYNKNQSNCKNIMVSIVEHSLSWSLKDDLLISASQKGLLYGNGIIINGQKLDYSEDPFLIPIDFNITYGTCAKYEKTLIIVVFEKEAIFKSFCNYIKIKGSLDSFENLVAITGKGFPDYLTKEFYQNLINTCSKKLRIVNLAFVDSDVFGINIMKNYHSPIDLVHAGVHLLEYTYGWLNITNRDFQLLQNFLINNESSKYSRELTRGMLLFKKCEMNLLPNDSINEYIIEKIEFYMNHK
ncbi:uncharacterized protein RJT21DRAFT_122263 [Scheffersomyces amazonensis]|uniref:uncharacterized protein n=1 Tax=Scheffersomyces amazonensis TaxID=1078765 RepID=UPI00315CF97C